MELMYFRHERRRQKRKPGFFTGFTFAGLSAAKQCVQNGEEGIDSHLAVAVNGIA